jgi:hypothetical protein
LRQQQSRPLLGLIRKQIQIACSGALPAGALAKASNYTLTLWNKLTFRRLVYISRALATAVFSRPILVVGRIHISRRQMR